MTELTNQEADVVLRRPRHIRVVRKVEVTLTYISLYACITRSILSHSCYSIYVQGLILLPPAHERDTTIVRYTQLGMLLVMDLPAHTTRTGMSAVELDVARSTLPHLEYPFRSCEVTLDDIQY